jgi:hypothetical protein
MYLRGPEVDFGEKCVPSMIMENALLYRVNSHSSGIHPTLVSL